MTIQCDIASHADTFELIFVLYVRVLCFVCVFDNLNISFEMKIISVQRHRTNESDFIFSN